MPNVFVVNNLPNKVNSFEGREQDGVYDELASEPGYFYDNGWLQIPVAAPDGAACELVKTSAAYARRTMTFRAARTGQAPRVPAPRGPERDANYKWVGGAVAPAVPTLAADGLTHVWVVSGHYTYAMRTPVFPEQGLPTGALPNDRTPVAQLAYPGAKFDVNLWG